VGALCLRSFGSRVSRGVEFSNSCILQYIATVHGTFLERQGPSLLPLSLREKVRCLEIGALSRLIHRKTDKPLSILSSPK
jgi:hypothetical protein